MEFIIGAVIIVAVVVAILLLRVAFKKDKIENSEVEEVAEIKEAQASEVNEHKTMKKVVAMNETIAIGENGSLPCGEYVIESCDGSDTCKVRIGRYVKEYKNGTTVVLGNNQKVTPVSGDIILK